MLSVNVDELLALLLGRTCRSLVETFAGQKVCCSSYCEAGDDEWTGLPRLSGDERIDQSPPPPLSKTSLLVDDEEGLGSEVDIDRLEGVKEEIDGLLCCEQCCS